MSGGGDYINDFLGEKITFDPEKQPEVVTDNDLNKGKKAAASVPEPDATAADTGAVLEQIQAAKSVAVERSQDRPEDDISAFYKDPLAPIESHFHSAENVRKAMKELGTDPNARNIIKPLAYEINKNLEDIASEVENYEYRIGFNNLDEAAHRAYYNYFEAGKTDKRLEYVRMRIIFEHLYIVNKSISTCWASLYESFRPMLLQKHSKVLAEEVMTMQIEPKVMLCKQTETLLQYFGTFMEAKGIKVAKGGKNLDFEGKYRDARYYTWESLISSIRENEISASGMINSVADVSNIEDAQKPIDTSLPEDAAAAPVADTPQSPPAEATAIDFITDPADVTASLDKKEEPPSAPVTKPAPTKSSPVAEEPSRQAGSASEPKYVMLPAKLKTAGDYYANPVMGTKDWNTNPLYELQVTGDDICQDEENLEKSFRVSTSAKDKLEKVGLNTAIVRAGLGKKKIPEYREFLYQTLTRIRSTLIPETFDDLDPELYDILVYHTTPNVYWRILLAVLQTQKIGFFSYVNPKKEIVNTFPNSILKAETILWWDEFQRLLDREEIDTYITFGKVVDYLQPLYDRDYRLARAKLDEFTRNHSAKVKNYNPESHFHKHRYNFFSPVKVHIYKRFLTKAHFQD